jgi:hypothetical protein
MIKEKYYVVLAQILGKVKLLFTRLRMLRKWHVFKELVRSINGERKGDPTLASLSASDRIASTVLV